MDLLVSLCEFIANLLEKSLASQKLNSSFTSAFNDELVLIDRIMDRVDYRRTEKNGFTVFVPRDIAAEAAAEVLPEPIAWQQLAYGHRSLKGDIEGKKALLVQLGRELESKRNALREVNPLLENRVFACLNRLDIRHDNRTEGTKKSNPKLSHISLAELEALYDDVYHMLLISFLELDGEESFKRVSTVAGVK